MSKIDPAFAQYLNPSPRVTYVHPQDHWFRIKLMRWVENSFGAQRLDNLYQCLRAGPDADPQFFANALTQANIRGNFTGFDLAQVPSQGPLLLAANHPFGIVDGLILCDLAMRLRGDFRILINALLCQDERLAHHFLPVDFAPTAAAQRTNIRTKALAVQALKDDVPVVVFPGGGIATANRFGFGELEEFPWTTFAAKLVKQSQATVLPLFFHGQNSRLFHVASHIGEPLRLALLIRETLGRFGQEVSVSVGDLLPYTQLAHMNRGQMTSFLQAASWSLATGAAA